MSENIQLAVRMDPRPSWRGFDLLEPFRCKEFSRVCSDDVIPGALVGVNATGLLVPAVGKHRVVGLCLAIDAEFDGKPRVAHCKMIVSGSELSVLKPDNKNQRREGPRRFKNGAVWARITGSGLEVDPAGSEDDADLFVLREEAGRWVVALTSRSALLS